MLHRLVAALAALCLSTVGISADEPKPVSAFVHLTEGCSGFYLGNGLIATASHCITKLTLIGLELSDGTKHTGNLALFADVETGFDDLAVLRVRTLPEDMETVALDCGPSPDIGTEIHMTGFPAYYGRATVWGRVADHPRPWVPDGYSGWHKDIVPIDITIFGGFSGSAVMTDNGAVVGVAVGALAGQLDLAVMVPANRLCELLDLEVGA